MCKSYAVLVICLFANAFVVNANDGVATRDQMMSALLREVKNCKQKVEEHQYGYSKLQKQVEKINASLEGTLDESSAKKLYDQILAEVVVEIERKRNDDIVCLSELLMQMSTKMSELERALGLSKQTPDPFPEHPGERPDAERLPNYQFPVDEIVYDRIALCGSAKILEKCKNINIGNQSFHGDLYIDCSGLRRLLVHQRSTGQSDFLSPVKSGAVQSVQYVDRYGRSIMSNQARRYP